MDSRLSLHNVVSRRRPAEGMTPLEAYTRIRQGHHGRRFGFLLESAGGLSRTSRYSFVWTDPFLIFRAKGHEIEIREPAAGRVTRLTGDPLITLRGILPSLSHPLPLPNPSPPLFLGGAVGFFGYDLIRLYERIPPHVVDDLTIPDILLLFVDSVIVFDHQEGWMEIIADRDKIEELEARLEIASGADSTLAMTGEGTMPHHHRTNLSFTSTHTKESYCEMVRRCQDYIAAGDIYQANLSQRFEAAIGDLDPLALYTVLRRINPSPFAAYLEAGDLQIVSSSPERLIKLQGRTVETRPLAGTRPRGKGPHEDEALRAELLINPKERAEHLMLVDLERNDIGRVCDYGSVRVDEFMATEAYSHVFHIVSNITGRLKEDCDWVDLLRAVFPGGTITGVPKVRCMQIIEELEPVARGPYTGSLGYITPAGDMDLNILIRTAVVKDGKAFIQVGAGIVADSVPEKEYEETLHKAQALLAAIRECTLIV